MKTSKSIVLKYNMKNLMSKLLPIVKKVNKKVNKIKSRVKKKIQSIKKIGSNKKVSNNREIKSLENNLSVEATKNIINTPKIAIQKSPIVVKPNVVRPSKIATKPKIVDKPKIATEKNNYKITIPAFKVCVSEITIPAFKVCVSEMQSKNIPRDKDITKNKMIWNHNCLKYNKENGYLERRHILWVFWDNKHITELCEKWICCDGNYAYTRFEELRTYSGEVFFTNEHKATLSEKESHTYIDIDDLKIFRDLYSEETILRTKKE